MSRNRSPLIVVLLGGLAAGPSLEPGRLLAASEAEADATQASMQERLNRVRADLFSRAGRVEEDIRELKDILALDPRSAEGHLLLGVAYRSLGAAELMGEAVAELRQAVALNPDFAPARFFLAHIYLDLGRPRRAREELQAALVRVREDPQLLALLGEAERQLKNPRRSIELTRQALRADESSAQARYYLGLALLDLGQRDEAIGELERVVQSGPKVVDAYLSLGAAYVEAGRLDEALRTLVQGTEMDPSRPDIRIELARAYRSTGSLDKADEQLSLATAKSSGSLAPSYYQHQQVEFDLHLERGLVKLQRGELQAAAEAFKKVIELDPSHGPANRHLAEVYLRQGLYAQAFEHAARAKKLGSPLPHDQRTLLEEGLRKRKAGRE